MNYDYPDASYERPRQITNEHEDYQKGLMYFLANDPKVPADVREKMTRWGAAKDEFKDHGYRPHQLYIREDRRMVGQCVIAETETFRDWEMDDPTGMGSYTLDAHTRNQYQKHIEKTGDR